jgi:hypothetical protein
MMGSSRSYQQRRQIQTAESETAKSSAQLGFFFVCWPVLFFCVGGEMTG